jgi:hypothetical protein
MRIAGVRQLAILLLGASGVLAQSHAAQQADDPPKTDSNTAKKDAKPAKPDAASQTPASPPATSTPSSASPASKPAAPTPPRPANGGGMVWVNSESGVYHKPGSRYYGKTKQGKYMTEADAHKAGYHAAKKQ